MKNLKKIITICLTGLVITSCNKTDEINTIKNNTENTTLQSKTKNRQDKSSGVAAAYHVYCSGTCENESGEECHLTGTLGDGSEPTIVQCHCEGCTMNYSSVASLPLDAKLINNIDFVMEDIDSYFTENYPIESLVISSVIFYKLVNNFVVIQVDYNNSTSTINDEITYQLEFDIEGELVKKTEIDCSGGCNSQGETCRESFNTGNGEVSCTCEGSCIMTLTEVPIIL